MTGYYIALGYNSTLGASGQLAANQELIEAAKSLALNPAQLQAEVKRVENIDIPIEYAEMYRNLENPAMDIRQVEGDSSATICQTASGGEPGRRCKEALRRAFCRLLIEKMHSKGIEVSLHVT